MWYEWAGVVPDVVRLEKPCGTDSTYIEHHRRRRNGAASGLGSGRHPSHAFNHGEEPRGVMTLTARTRSLTLCRLSMVCCDVGRDADGCWQRWPGPGAGGCPWLAETSEIISSCSREKGLRCAESCSAGPWGIGFDLSVQWALP